MNTIFWRQLRGGSTNLPIVLLAASLCLLILGWRLFGSGRIPQRRFGVYFAAVLMLGAGYYGGELLLGWETGNDRAPSLLSAPGSSSSQKALVGTGQQLFLKNCAHCHGADARGDEGPDLHNLDWTDAQIATRIRNGKKGQMPAFAGKFSSEDISEVIAYLRTLR